MSEQDQPIEPTGGNGKKPKAKPKCNNNGRKRHVKNNAQIAPGHKSNGDFAVGNPYAWKPGQSGNPRGVPSLGRHVREAFRAKTTQVAPDGHTLTYDEALALHVRNLSLGTGSDHLQSVALKLVFDRLDPVVQEIHLADVTPQVQAELSERAREFQRLCEEAAIAQGGRLSSVEVEVIRERLTIDVTDVTG